jgi:hypothetical protein
VLKPRRIRGRPVLTRYWFEFDRGETPPTRPERLGCGVTAFDREDALRLLARTAFANEEVPPVSRVTEDIDVQMLDEGHVLPNIGPPSERGVWFPNYSAR